MRTMRTPAGVPEVPAPLPGASSSRPNPVAMPPANRLHATGVEKNFSSLCVSSSGSLRGSGMIGGSKHRALRSGEDGRERLHPPPSSVLQSETSITGASVGVQAPSPVQSAVARCAHDRTGEGACTPTRWCSVAATTDPPGHERAGWRTRPTHTLYLRFSAFHLIAERMRVWPLG